MKHKRFFIPHWVFVVGYAFCSLDYFCWRWNPHLQIWIWSVDYGQRNTSPVMLWIQWQSRIYRIGFTFLRSVIGLLENLASYSQPIRGKCRTIWELRIRVFQRLEKVAEIFALCYYWLTILNFSQVLSDQKRKVDAIQLNSWTMRAISAFTDNHVCMLCSQLRTALIARDIGRFYARDVKVVKTNLTSEMFKSSVKCVFETHLKKRR